VTTLMEIYEPPHFPHISCLLPGDGSPCLLGYNEFDLFLEN
jgi:hypothetical protein